MYLLYFVQYLFLNIATIIKKMCGIIGILQKEENSIPILIKSLIQLRNRGYDSAGIGFVNKDSIKIVKKANSFGFDVFRFLGTINDFSNCAIGHTRWATHGPKIDKNSHPHVSSDGTCIIVHNGIIQNYKEIKSKLKNYTFTSDTDSEVIATLISFHYKQTKNHEDAIIKTINELSGTWGLVIMFLDSPNTIYCIRHGSPLLITHNEDIFMVSSEQSGFCNLTSNYITLQNGDLCKATIETGKINVTYNSDYVSRNVIVNNYPQTPHPYSHWTLKEIYEQVQTCNSATNYGARINNNIVTLGGLQSNVDILKDVKNVILLGCGTSYNATCASRHYFTKKCKFNCVQVFDGAEFTKEDISKYGKTLLILVTQSGETKDLYRCLEMATGCITLGVVNVVDSLIAREVDCGCYTNCGREVAVASTKSFTSQLIVLSLIAFWFSHLHNSCLVEHALDDCRILPLQIGQILKKIQFLNVDKLDKRSIFILGKGKMEYIANEGSLKIKEMSYIHAEGYAASSLKHGPFALLDKNVIVILLINKYCKDEMLTVYEQVKSRECPIMIITDCETIDCDENDLQIPYNKNYDQILFAVALQYIAYSLALNHGIDPDFPRNLAKVVTVD